MCYIQLPYPLEFYQITYENELYLIPKDVTSQSLFNTKQITKKGLVAIPEKEVIRGLKAYTLANPLPGTKKRVKTKRRFLNSFPTYFQVLKW